MRRLLSVTATLLVTVTMLAADPMSAVATVPDTTPVETSPVPTDPPDTIVDTTTTTSTPMQQATRGSTIQLVPTSPPPTTAAPKPSGTITPPANSGTGRRVVYSKGRMRVWIVEADGMAVRTYLVSGRLSQPAYGTYSVFSRSAYTCNINHPNVCMRWMVRFAKGTSGDNIGFHEIPRKDGVPVQSESQLGQALSSGCVRQGTADAWFMWNWAYVGTKVVVIP